MNVDSRENWRRHALNITVIVLAIVALYWRVFFLGESVIDVRTLDNQLPWGHSASTEVNHPYNRRDPTDMYLTREYFIAQAYRDGELPLWNPYTFAGHPIYADGVTRIFSPFLLFYTFLDMPLGYTVARLAELLLGAVFLYLFLIAIGVSARGALAGALVFELSAHSLFHLTGLGWWGGLMWLPLIFLFIDRAIRRNDFKPAILAGVFVAMQFFCGYMPNQIYYLAAVVLYYLFFGWRVRGLVAEATDRTFTAGRLFAMQLVTLGVGLALAATQWVPVMELLGFSNRRVVPTEAGYIYLPPWYIVTLIFPDLFGTAYDARMVTLFTALSVSHDHSLYLGIAALLPLGFLIYSLVRKRRKRKSENHPLVSSEEGDARRGDGETITAETTSQSIEEVLREKRVKFFMGFVVFALFVMMAAPVYVYVTQFFPVLRSIRVIVRAGVLFIFAAAVLVGFGADALLAAGKDELARFSRLAKRCVITVCALVGVGVAGFIALKVAGVVNDGNFDYVAGTGKLAYLRSVLSAFAAQFAPPRASVLVPLVLLLVGFLLLKFWQSGKITTPVFFWLLVVFIVADLSVNSLQYDETHDRSRVFPATQITDKLKSLPSGRVLVAPSGIESNRRERAAEEEKIIAPPNTLLAYQIPTVTGKDQLFPKAYREFCSLIEPQPHLSHVVFNKTESRFFDLLGVKYVLTHESQPAPTNHDLLMKADGLALYENKNALPRAFFVESVLQQSAAEAVLSSLRREDFNARTTAVMEIPEHWGDYAHSLVYSTASARAEVTSESRNRIVIETENAGEGFLVVSDNWYPGWTAAIDGEATEVLRVNHTMRAVRVPAGRHMVSFTFAPKTFWMSVYVSLASAATVFLSLILLRQRRGTAA